MAELCEFLAERRGELESATLARAQGIADPGEVPDPAYSQGLREAISAGVGYGLAALAAPRTEVLPGPVPAPLLAQARFAARSGVPLETVLRRYFAGHALLGDLIAAAAQQGSAGSVELREALRRQGVVVDRVVSAVAEEYGQEARGRARGPERRRAERVRMLLAGELVEEAELGYPLAAWHIGALAEGPGAKAALRELADVLDRRLLVVRAEPGALWAWLGGRTPVAAKQVLATAKRLCPREVSMALGEPGEGVEGWRLTHRQARGAMRVARAGPEPRLAYADVVLLVSALGDEVLTTSLYDTFLAPLEGERIGGEVLRQTLSAYLGAGGNVSAAAARLGASRRTINARLSLVEERLGRTIGSCRAELQLALTLQVLRPEVDGTRLSPAEPDW
jgi:hypothetical protein